MFNLRNSTAATSGLSGLAWNAFATQTVATGYAQLPKPSFIVDQVTTTQGPSGSYSSMVLRTLSNGVAPSWCKPGFGVSINITVAGVSIVATGLVRDVSSSGKLITITSLSLSDQTYNGTVGSYTNQALDATGGSVVNTLTLVTQAQKVMFSNPAANAANITITPSWSNDGNGAVYSVTLVPGGPEYEVTAPTGAKFDINDWWALSATGFQILTVRFL